MYAYYLPSAFASALPGQPVARSLEASSRIISWGAARIMTQGNLWRIASASILLAAIASGQDNNNIKETADAAFDPQAARGTITNVVTLYDPSQSYALFLPSQYSPGRRWPVIYAFDPFARGKTAVEVYRPAAEKYGYIIAGSNNAKNGPTGPEMEAAQAMWNDTHRRLSIDKERTYTTGLSGGARVATTFA